MDRPAARLALLALLALLAAVSLTWAAENALDKSDDLMRRAEEVALFVAGEDPYRDPDMTYPPTALPVFAPLVAPFAPGALRGAWLALNLGALAVCCASIVRLWGPTWPAWLAAAFCLVVAASKPVRGGIGLGQFHLIPMALLLLAVVALRARRPVVAGLLVGIALAKPTMTLPFLGYLAARRHGRALATAGLFQGVALLAVSGWLRLGPGRLIREWLANARTQSAAGMLDLPSLVERAWPRAPLTATQISLATLALGFALVLAYRRKPEIALVSTCTSIAAIFTYHRPYDLVLLIPALAFAIDVARKARGGPASLGAPAAVVFAVLLIAPSHPSIAGRFEAYHEVAFIPLTYAFLGLNLAWLRGSPGGDVRTEDHASGSLREIEALPMDRPGSRRSGEAIRGR